MDNPDKPDFIPYAGRCSTCSGIYDYQTPCPCEECGPTVLTKEQIERINNRRESPVELYQYISTNFRKSLDKLGE